MRNAPLDLRPTAHAADSTGSPGQPADDVMPRLLLPDDAVVDRKAAIGGRRPGKPRPRTAAPEARHQQPSAQEPAATEGEIAKDRDPAEDCALLHPAPAESKAYAPAKRR